MDKPKWAPRRIMKPEDIVVKEIQEKPESEKQRKAILNRFEAVKRSKQLRGAKRQERINLMRELRAKGFTLQEIGDEFGITRERVRQIVKVL